MFYVEWMIMELAINDQPCVYPTIKSRTLGGWKLLVYLNFSLDVGHCSLAWQVFRSSEKWFHDFVEFLLISANTLALNMSLSAI
jgi:hypothetical protein